MKIALWILATSLLSAGAPGDIEKRDTGRNLIWRVAEQNSADVISANTAYEKARKGELILIDIRQPDEWKSTGIGEGAHPLTMHQSADGFFTKLAELTENDKTRPLALICAVGGRSAYLQKYLTKSGYTQVTSVGEGMMGSKFGPGWIKSELPVKPFSGDR